MFGYFGSKRDLGHCYPTPRHDLVIEAFAGSASYALHGDNWRRDVLLVERNESLAMLWRWLINDARPADIVALPDLQVGQPLSQLPTVMRAVLAHVATVGNEATEDMVVSWSESRAGMADNVEKVKHWKVNCASYDDAPSAEATWFIDPPYQGPVGSGYLYGSSTIDFAHLAEWSRSRHGQVIACESGCATYLPFVPVRPLTDRPGDPHAEFVWHSNRRAGHSFE